MILYYIPIGLHNVYRAHRRFRSANILEWRWWRRGGDHARATLYCKLRALSAKNAASAHAVILLYTRWSAVADAARGRICVYGPKQSACWARCRRVPALQLLLHILLLYYYTTATGMYKHRYTIIIYYTILCDYTTTILLFVYRGEWFSVVRGAESVCSGLHIRARRRGGTVLWSISWPHFSGERRGPPPSSPPDANGTAYIHTIIIYYYTKTIRTKRCTTVICTFL